MNGSSCEFSFSSWSNTDILLLNSSAGSSIKVNVIWLQRENSFISFRQNVILPFNRNLNWQNEITCLHTQKRIYSRARAQTQRFTENTTQNRRIIIAARMLLFFGYIFIAFSWKSSHSNRTDELQSSPDGTPHTECRANKWTRLNWGNLNKWRKLLLWLLFHR